MSATEGANPRQRMHGIVCDLGQTLSVLTEIAGMVEDGAENPDGLPIHSLTRLLRAVEDDVRRAYVGLDQLWLDTSPMRAVKS